MAHSLILPRSLPGVTLPVLPDSAACPAESHHSVPPPQTLDFTVVTILTHYGLGSWVPLLVIWLPRENGPGLPLGFPGIRPCTQQEHNRGQYLVHRAPPVSKEGCGQAELLRAIGPLCPRYVLLLPNQQEGGPVRPRRGSSPSSLFLTLEATSYAVYCCVH